MKKILLIVSLILLVSFLIIIQATAEDNGSTTPLEVTFDNPVNATSVQELINNLIDFIYTISIPLLVIVVLWAGFTMITAGGKAENFKKGQNILLYAAIGFAIILLSKGVSLIISDLLNAGGTTTPTPTETETTPPHTGLPI
jgi:hypothetical protein